MTELREFRRARGNLDQDAARTCNGALQEFYKHPWGSQSNASPILLLPPLVGKLFENDGVAHSHDLMDLVAMQTLAVGSQLAFFGGLSASGLFVVSARFPVQLLLALLLDTTLLIIVVGIGCPSLAIHLALEPTDFLLIRYQVFTQDLKAGFGLPRGQRDGRWPYICPDRVTSHCVLGLAIRHAFQSQLHTVAVSLGVSRLRLWAAGLALHQADVLDAMIQPVFHDRVVPVDDCRKLVVFPDEVALVALRWLVQHKAQAGIVAVVLDTGKSSSPALEADAAGFSQAHPIEGIVGTAGKGLGQHRIQVVGDPGLPCSFGILVQGGFAEALMLPQRSKGRSSLLLAGN